MKERLEENLEFFKDLVKRDLDRQPEKVNLQVLLLSTVLKLDLHGQVLQQSCYCHCSAPLSLLYSAVRHTWHILDLLRSIVVRRQCH